ncbi:MAG: winged helix-turn-helix domain-containing protein [Candidatus Kariarchaeaceae archaeon]
MLLLPHIDLKNKRRDFLLDQIEETILRNNYELYNRLQNEKRKKLLVFIYEEQRNYTQLMDFSGLKPGSLYHHLKILEPLIEKQAHGLYAITTLGTKIVDQMNLIHKGNQKPTVQSITNNEDPIVIPSNGGSDKSLDSVTTNVNELNEWSDPLAVIWIGFSSYVLIGTTILVMLLLGIQGVAFAGSAIYAIDGRIVFAYDFIAFIFGMGSLWYIENATMRFEIYNRIKFIFSIRIISMLPGVIVGISLLLLYFGGISPPSTIFPIIFVITLLLGTFTAAMGITYLRSQSFTNSLLIAVVPGMIDLLIGVVVLLTQMQ